MVSVPCIQISRTPCHLSPLSPGHQALGGPSPTDPSHPSHRPSALPKLASCLGPALPFPCQLLTGSLCPEPLLLGARQTHLCPPVPSACVLAPQPPAEGRPVE